MILGPYQNMIELVSFISLTFRLTNFSKCYIQIRRRPDLPQHDKRLLFVYNECKESALLHMIHFRKELFIIKFPVIELQVKFQKSSLCDINFQQRFACNYCFQHLLAKSLYCITAKLHTFSIYLSLNRFLHSGSALLASAMCS